MKAKATIRLKLPSTKHLATLRASLNPEVDQTDLRRAKVILENEKDSILLRVEADDVVALRSTLNAYLRWIYSVNNVVSVIDSVS